MKYLDIIKTKLGAYPIGAWVPYYDHNLTAEYFADMKNCGINFIPTNNCKKEELDFISNAGMKLMVNDERVSYVNITGIVNVKDYLSEYSQREDVLSVFIWDEPTPTMMDLCAVINKQVNKYCDNIFGYINLHPNYSSQDIQREDRTYAEYLQYFVDTCKPKVISYDHYPFYKDNVGSEKMFENLDDIRNCCNNNGLEFMTFIQSAEYFNHVLPTKAMLNYQVATSLAYGAKGILYFTYAQVIHDANNECFGPAVLDKQGNKTHVYYDIMSINRKIQEKGQLFMELKHKGVVFFSEKFFKYSTITPDFNVDCEEILVGVFEREDQRYLYVVNLNLEKTQTVTVKDSEKECVITLESGAGELIRF